MQQIRMDQDWQMFVDMAEAQRQHCLIGYSSGGSLRVFVIPRPAYFWLGKDGE